MAYLRRSLVEKIRMCCSRQHAVIVRPKHAYLMACGKRFGEHHTKVTISSVL